MVINIKPLNINEHDVFTTSLPLKMSFIRTGVEGAGSCFFHSLFLSFKEFRMLSQDERRLYIEKKRKDLAKRLTLSEWFGIQQGNVAFLQIIEMMRIMIYILPTYVSDPRQHSIFDSYNIDVKLLDILFHLLDSAKVDHNMLPDWDVQCCQIEKNGLDEEILLHRMKSKWHQIYQDNIRQAIYELEKSMDHQEKMTESQKLAVIHKLSEISYFIFDFVVEKTLQNFQDDIASYSTWVNTFHLLCIVHCLNLPCNFIFIDATTGLPYEGMRYFCLDKMNENGHPYAFLLYFPDFHFESLGERIERSGKRYINRLFKNDHPYVCQCIQYFQTLPSTLTRFPFKQLDENEY
jgi:hypothetical protein